MCITFKPLSFCFFISSLYQQFIATCPFIIKKDLYFETHARVVIWFITLMGTCFQCMRLLPCLSLGTGKTFLWWCSALPPPPASLSHILFHFLSFIKFIRKLKLLTTFKCTFFKKLCLDEHSTYL